MAPAGKKRKAVDLEAERQERSKMHRSLMTKVIVASRMVDISVGQDKQVFSIHKDLLALHSNYFATLFSTEEEDFKSDYPQFKPQAFVAYHSWLYCGELLEEIGDDGGEEALWELGRFLGSPTFQNLCMDRGFRHACKIEPKHWMYVSTIESVYTTTQKDSLARKFTADQMNCLNPLKQYKEGGTKWLEWNALLERHPDLRSDMTKATRQEWNGNYPWDDQYRDEYMEEEFSLEQRWEDQILARRTAAEVDEGAKSGEVQSILEQRHLRRKKVRV